MQERTLLEFIISYRIITDNKQDKFHLGEITVAEVQLLKEILEIDTTGFKRIIDNFGVKHAFKSHGRIEFEERRGQIAIEPVDFELIITTVNTFDQFTAELGKKGLPIVKYEKIFDDFVLIYAEEIRFGRKEIAFQTLYKRKIRKP